MVSVFGVKFSLDPLSEHGGAQGTISAELELVFGVVADEGDEVDDDSDTSVCWASIKARISSCPGKPA